MMYFTPLKTAVILGLCLLGAILCIPNLFPAPAAWLPWRTVHLGLDLRGGSYLLLEIDMKAVIKERLNNIVDAVRQALRPGAIFYQTLEAQPEQNRMLLKLRDASKTEAAIAAIRPLIVPEGPTGAPEFDLASTPDGTITLTLSPVALHARALGAVQQSIEIVRRRIDETGVVDPQITQQGDSRIVVQLPGISDPNRIKELLGQTAHMTFQLVDETANPTSGAPPPPGVDFLPMQDNPNQKVAVRRRIDVDGGDLTDARAGTNGQTGEWVVNFTFNSVGARRFADITRANVNHRFAIVLDGKVISAPVIREPITGGRGQISGSFTAASANDLAVLLRAGALPAPLTVVEERSVGPELGADFDPGWGDFARCRVRAGDRLHGCFLWSFRLVRECLPGGEPGADAGCHVAAAGHTDTARHGGNPADAGHGGGCEHPDQRANPRGTTPRPAAAVGT